MRLCPACGQENPEQARFCFACATPLEPEAPERRKLATMLFCDMSGSTAMGERVDAESVREMMFSYFHEMRGAIERHGGTVEKFIGDAVMAVFGVPVAHEDDALRACRAAFEMQERLGALNEGLERRYGSTIALRIGVNTGEVVAGDATARQALVTGDAVNVAARLEQAASPGQILIGEPTYRLVRDAVSIEPVSPLELKGKSEPLPAYRLTDVQLAAPARARRLDTPIVGRDAELARLRDMLDEVAQGRCLLATIVGEPGVGKSRLAAELIASAPGEIEVLSGRCLQYGEGITYRPIAEIVHQAAGIRDEHTREEALRRIEELAPGDEAPVVAQAIGLAAGEAETGEIARAIANLLRSYAGDRPLLVLVDDIHWAEPALRELLAGLPTAIADVPILVLCLARPELLEDLDWTATVRLQPLEQSDSTTLVEQLLGEATLPEGVAERISSAAAGNPLFVEELVGMLIDDGLLERRDGSWAADPSLAQLAIPPTLRELLGARLDRMPAGERSALERGAVEGQVFHRGAVEALSEPGRRLDVPASLQALLEREYLRPARADFVEEAAFRVRHILIRDAAYEGIPKKLRASLHERFADWLEERAGDRTTEYEEILGYHLEQAYRYLEELGPIDDRGRTLAARGVEKLGAAGNRAFVRRDIAAVGLLRRAAALLPARDATRIEYLQSASELMADASWPETVEFASEVLREATESGQRGLIARAEAHLSWLRFNSDPGYGGARFLADLEELEPVFREAGDEHGLARLHDGRAYVHDFWRQSAVVEREADLQIELARRAGNRRTELEAIWWLLWQLPQGPRPVEEAIERCHSLRSQLGGDLAAEAVFLEALAELEAMRGRLEQARALARSSIEIRTELGMHGLRTGTVLRLAAIELAARELETAESLIGALLATPHGTPDDAWIASDGGSLLAEVRLAQGRLEEAKRLTHDAKEAALPDHVVMQVRWRCARAKIQSRTGEPEAGEALAREAVELTRSTDDLNLQGTALATLALVLATAARWDLAVQAAEESLQLYERKGNVVAAASTRALLEEWGRTPNRSSSGL